MTEATRAIVFSRGDDHLLGILSLPRAAGTTGVVIAVGGPQYRAGSHRQFVLLARHLAAGGFPVLRFDYRGMGDSAGEPRNFQQVDDDIGAAIDALQANCPGITRVVLWGLCDAASSALLYWHRRRDPRLAGLCLLNPWVRSETTLARAQIKHYYGQRLLQPEFWKKLLRGGVPVGKAVAGLAEKLAQSFRPASRESGPELGFQERMAIALAEFPGAVLVILSERDHTAKEFLEYAAMTPRLATALDRPNLRRADIAGADHTFSSAAWRGEVERTTLDWLNSLRSPA